MNVNLTTKCKESFAILTGFRHRPTLLNNALQNIASFALFLQERTKPCQMFFWYYSQTFYSVGAPYMKHISHLCNF